MPSATLPNRACGGEREGLISNEPIAAFETWHYLWRDVWQLYPDHLRHKAYFIKFRLSRRDIGLEHLKPDTRKRWWISPPSELLLLVSVCHWGVFFLWLFAFRLPLPLIFPVTRLFLWPFVAILPFSIERQILFAEERSKMRLPWWQARRATAFSKRVAQQITCWNEKVPQVGFIFEVTRPPR